MRRSCAGRGRSDSDARSILRPGDREDTPHDTVGITIQRRVERDGDNSPGRGEEVHLEISHRPLPAPGFGVGEGGGNVWGFLFFYS